MDQPGSGGGPGAGLGRYDVLEEIARGGAGVVHRARDRASGRLVALKILRQVDPGDLEALRREIHALGRVRHPGIVRVLDAGPGDRPPWYAMELIAGGTLADLWSREGGAPTRAAIERRLRLLWRLCEPLAFLHAEGIVHRDLKPGNVVFHPDRDAPVLVDFGLVSTFGAPLAREALEVGGDLAGTVHYMAPEQVRGEYVDARADLYALGCILHEAVTGRTPLAGSAGEVLQHHLASRHVPCDPAIDALDPRLRALIRDLLAGDPRDRLGHAEDVAEALREAGFGDRDAPAAGPRRSYLYRPSFAGRARELRLLREALDAARAGSGRLLLVAGESGSGKTRLAMEATREARARGFRVITGECLPAESVDAGSRVRGSPLHPLRPLLRSVGDLCALDGEATTARLLGRRAKTLAPYEPTLAGVPGFREQAESSALSARGQRERVLADLTGTLAAMARAQPILLVLDDLQWADDMTLSWLGDASFEESAVLVVGTYRREEMGPELEALAAARREQILPLPRLGSDSVRSIVTDMLGAKSPPDTLVRVLARDSEGNPFFVCEYLRAAIEAQLLRREPGGRWRVETTDQTGDPARGSLPLPTTLRELVDRRLRALDPATLEVVAAAAVLGRDFEGALAVALSGLEAAQGVASLRLLVERELVAESGPDRFRFAHDKLREVSYARIPEPRAVGLHSRAARTMEAELATRLHPEARYAELANHWTKAGVGEKAIRYFARAGEHALATGAYNDAHHWLVRALALDDERGQRADAFERARWRRMLGEAAFARGDLQASIRFSTDALVGFGERVPESRAGWLRIAGWEGLRLAAAAPWRRRRPRREPDERLREVSRGCCQLSTSYFYDGAPAAAGASLLRGLSLAERAGDDAAVLISCARLGYVAGTMRLHRLSRHWFGRAYALSLRIDAPGGRGLTLYLDAQYQQNMGRWARGYELATESADLLDAIGDTQEAEVARTMAANNLFYAGEIARANETLRRATESADHRSQLQHVAWRHFLAARSQLVSGDPKDAIALCEAALPLLEPLPDLLSTAMCEGTYATALWAAGRAQDALVAAEKLSRRLAGGRRPLVSQCLDCYGALAEVYLGHWEAASAADAPRRALAARKACRELRWFAHVFPMAVPAAQRCSAREQWLLGARSRALRAWRRSAASARQLGMPYWEARAQRDLAALAPGEEERRLHRDEARRLFRSLGAERHLAELDAS